MPKETYLVGAELMENRGEGARSTLLANLWLLIGKFLKAIFTFYRRDRRGRGDRRDISLSRVKPVKVSIWVNLCSGGVYPRQTVYHDLVYR